MANLSLRKVMKEEHLSEELDVLKSVAQRLDQKGISYMITGSIATNFYTVPKMTRDIGIVVELDTQKVAEIFKLSGLNSTLIERQLPRPCNRKGCSISFIMRSLSK